MHERRQFDRIIIPPAAGIFMDDDHGSRLGRVLVLGRGGLLLQSNRQFALNVVLTFNLVGERDGIRRQINVFHRYVTPAGDHGFEFRNLDPDAAVEIGVLIGKYFDALGAAE